MKQFNKIAQVGGPLVWKILEASISDWIWILTWLKHSPYNMIINI